MTKIIPGRVVCSAGHYFRWIIAEMNRVHIGVGRQGLLLNCEDFEIGIEKLSISTEHVQLSDCTYEIDEETKLYYYAPTSGVSIPYTKEELEDYLYNEKITLKISVELSMCQFLRQKSDTS